MARAEAASSDLLVPAAAPTLCLAYANTLSWRGSPAPSDSLRDPDALLTWIEREAGLGAGALNGARARVAVHAPEAASLFAEAIALRETIYRVFEAFAAGRQPSDGDFGALSAAIAAAPPRVRLARHGTGYVWRIEAPGPSAPQLLAPVLWSAADLLLEAGHRRIRQCANEKCLWLFVDESKGGTRRWCDMTSCGNRAKAQRHYAKVRRA